MSGCRSAPDPVLQDLMLFFDAKCTQECFATTEILLVLQPSDAAGCSTNNLVSKDSLVSHEMYKHALCIRAAHTNACTWEAHTKSCIPEATTPASANSYSVFGLCQFCTASGRHRLGSHHKHAQNCNQHAKVGYCQREHIAGQRLVGISSYLLLR